MTVTAAPGQPPLNPLLSSAILPTLVRLSWPNIVALSATSLVAIAETSYIGILGTEPLAARDLARVVTRVEAGQIYGLESLLGRANQLQGYNHYLGDPDRLGWDLERYRAVTPAQIVDVAKKTIQLDKAVVIITEPGESK